MQDIQMDKNIYEGRPQNEGSRLPKELAVYDLLDRLQISYRRVDHEPLMTIEACQAVDQLLGVEICKNLFLCNRQQTQFYLLLMPGKKTFKTKYLSQQIGSARLSFGDAEHMEKYLNITPGSVSVMGLMNDRENQVQLLIDKELLEEEWFGCHPCINTSCLVMKTRDVLEKILPAIHHEYRAVELPAE